MQYGITWDGCSMEYTVLYFIAYMPRNNKMYFSLSPLLQKYQILPPLLPI
jgi:hypothetical protein